MRFEELLVKYEKKKVVEFGSKIPDLPVISILVVTFQHENYIRKCLDGLLLQQTTFPFEILLGEDDSEDNTRAICIEYAKKYPDKIRLFLHHRENNIKIDGDPSGRFNLMYNIFSAKGEYIALCEGDDYWTDPFKLQKQVDFLEANIDYNICFHKVEIFNQKENKLKIDSLTRDVPETTNIEELAKGNFIHTPSVVLRNNFVLPKWFSKSPTGDWTLYMIAIKDKKIKKLDEVMAAYRIHSYSVWSSKQKKKRLELTISNFKIVLKNLSLSSITKKMLDQTIKKYEKELKEHSKFIVYLNKFKSLLALNN